MNLQPHMLIKRPLSIPPPPPNMPESEWKAIVNHRYYTKETNSHILLTKRIARPSHSPTRSPPSRPPPPRPSATLALLRLSPPLPLPLPLPNLTPQAHPPFGTIEERADDHVTWNNPFFFDNYGRCQWLYMPSGCTLGEDFFSMDQLPLPNYETRRRPKRYIHEFAIENKRIMSSSSTTTTCNPVAFAQVVSSNSKATEISDGIVQCHRLNAAFADVRRQLSVDADGSDTGIGDGGGSGIVDDKEEVQWRRSVKMIEMQRENLELC